MNDDGFMLYAVLINDGSSDGDAALYGCTQGFVTESRALAEFSSDSQMHSIAEELLPLFDTDLKVKKPRHANSELARLGTRFK